MLENQTLRCSGSAGKQGVGERRKKNCDFKVSLDSQAKVWIQGGASTEEIWRLDSNPTRRNIKRKNRKY